MMTRPDGTDGLERYLTAGILPGDFLRAVLENDLRMAILRADPVNRGRLPELVEWLWHHAPAAAWGSPEAVQAWSAQRRQERLRP
jgi:hypothetical protein